MNFIRVAGLYSWLCIFLLCEPITGNLREITVERMETEYLDKSYGDYNYTLTDKTITVYLNIFKNDLEKNLDIHILIYSFEDNEYRLRPISISRNICAFLNLEWNYMKETFAETDHVVRSCPIEKGLYYAINYKVDPVNLPHVPWKKVLVHAKLIYKDVLVGSVKVYVNIDQDMNVVTSAPRKSLLLNKMHSLWKH